MSDSGEPVECGRSCRINGFLAGCVRRDGHSVTDGGCTANRGEATDRDSLGRCGHPAEQYAGVPGGPCVRRHGHPLDHGGHTASAPDANHRDAAAEIRPCGECGAMKRLDMYGYCSVGCGTARAVAAPKYETVDHPPHYNAHPAGVECIAIIEHMTFSVGSAVKYLWRHGIKPGAGAAEDIRKAIWYLQRELERISGGVR